VLSSTRGVVQPVEPASALSTSPRTVTDSAADTVDHPHPVTAPPDAPRASPARCGSPDFLNVSTTL